MDEQRLGELFRDAVGEPPPPSFGRAEVVAASRRATARRRGTVAGGTLLGVAMLTAGVLAGGVPGGGVRAGSALGDGASETSTAERAAPQATAHAPAEPVAPELPHTLGTAPGSGTPTARAGAGCAPRDDVLAAELTEVLAGRGVEAAGPAGEVPGPCPPGARAAAVPVLGGAMYVLVVPQVNPPEQNDLVQPDGRREHALMLDRGRGLVLISTPAVAGQSAPLGADLPELAEELAKRL